MDFEPCAYMNSILSLERQPENNEILILVCLIAAMTNKILVLQLERFWQGNDFWRTGLVVVSCHCGKIGMHYALFWSLLSLINWCWLIWESPRKIGFWLVPFSPCWLFEHRLTLALSASEGCGQRRAEWVATALQRGVLQAFLSV